MSNDYVKYSEFLDRSHFYLTFYKGKSNLLYKIQASHIASKLQKCDSFFGIVLKGLYLLMIPFVQLHTVFYYKNELCIKRSPVYEC